MFQILGKINSPSALNRFGDVSSGGLGKFLNLILNILVVAGGIYAVFNLVLAGYAFMAAGGEPKKIADAWAKIWQTMVGLLFIAGSFLLAAILGWLIFGNTTALLFPRIETP